MTRQMHLISKAGKTFYFATLWLAKKVRYETALAYNFCRTVDDLADATPIRPDRDSQLSELERAIECGDHSHVLTRPLLPLITLYPEIREPLRLLVAACKEDGPQLNINDQHDLKRYAHGVAGNVGLIMYPILGGVAPLGRSHAAELGIAMQYTNIARDILEDRARGRIYLPASWLAGRDPLDILKGDVATEEVMVDAVRRLLNAAKEHYERGLAGLGYLAKENRFAIALAARCYAAIGDRVITRHRLSRERAVVPLSRKIIIACTSSRLSVERDSVDPEPTSYSI